MSKDFSFSGANTKTYAYFPQRPDLITMLDTVHTVSVSVHEAKSPARALGYRGIKGLTRGIRTIAGSMIFTVVNDHPLRVLQDQYNEMTTELGTGSYLPIPLGWSVDRDDMGVGSFQDVLGFKNRLTTLLPPFNLILTMVSETTPVEYDLFDGTDRVLFPGAGLMLQGIEVIDEGYVVSVNDLVTEITCSYIAKDFKPISANTFQAGGEFITYSEIAQKQYDLWKMCHPDQAQVTGSTYGLGAE